MTRRNGTDYLRFTALEAAALRDAVLSPRLDAAELLVRAAAVRGLERAVDLAADFATGRAVRGRDTAPRDDAAGFAAAGLAGAAGSRVSAAERPFPSTACGALCTGVKRIWSPMA
jgi:hypothetical protein